MHPRIHFRTALPILILSAIIISLHAFYGSRSFAPVFAILLFVLVLLVHFFIEKPLLHIQNALDRNDTSLIEKLRKSKSRFGRLAELVSQSFIQKERLRAEIDERARAETKLADQEKRFRDLFETAPDAIICTDTSGSIILTNQHALTILDYRKPETPVGKSISSFSAGTSSLSIERLLATSDDGRQIRDFECAMRKRNGDIFTAEIRLVQTLPGNEGSTLIFHIRDITRQKAAEGEKLRLEEQFRVAYKLEAIGKLAGGIAHDYNNILGAISGYADLIHQRYNGDERLDRYANMILSATGRASELTKKLLIFARKNKLNMTDFDAQKTLSEVIELLQHTLEKEIFILYRNNAEKTFIHGDTVLFQNAIMNLALNARDAMPSGGNLVIQSDNMEIGAAAITGDPLGIVPGKYFTVTVSDNGIGMDENTKKRIFEPFFTTKDIGEGTGLGLASVYGTIKSHNGHIEVRSAPGEGTSFYIYFPLVEQVLPETPGHERHSTVAGKGHILFVDDEEFLRDAVREMLAWLGYEVTVCADGFEALAIYSPAPERFDLVILDMKMPGMTGLDCFERMKQLRPGVRALISTGYCIDEERQKVFDEGILGIIQKPFVSAQLAHAVNEALG